MGGSDRGVLRPEGQRDHDRGRELDLPRRPRRHRGRVGQQPGGRGGRDGEHDRIHVERLGCGRRAENEPPAALPALQLPHGGAQPHVRPCGRDERVEQHPVAAAHGTEHGPTGPRLARTHITTRLHRDRDSRAFRARLADGGALIFRESRSGRARVAVWAHACRGAGGRVCGGGQGGGAGVERRGQGGHGGPQAERVDAAGVDAAEQRVGEAVDDLVAEAGAQQPAQRDVAARLPVQRPPRLGGHGGQPGGRQQPVEPGGAGRDAEQGAGGQRPGAARGPDGRGRRRRVHQHVGQAQLGEQRGHLGPAGEERLGADVEGHPGEVDGVQHAADAVALLEHVDAGGRAEQRAQPVCRGEPGDPGADDRDARRSRFAACAPARRAG